MSSACEDVSRSFFKNTYLRALKQFCVAHLCAPLPHVGDEHFPEALDLLRFADIIQRTLHIRFKYAFVRLALATREDGVRIGV